jgi:ribosomal-protein-alanine N-acetyltransferase
MQFNALPQSDHPLVAMRPIEATDLPTWANYLNLPSVYEHTSWNRPTVEDLGSYVWHEAMRTPSSLLRLAVALRSSNELVGTIGFHTVNPANQSAELAYDLSPNLWRHGIATHLCRLVVRWAHTNAAVIRVQATVLESNARSIQVLERAGFAPEGLLRCYRIVRGTPRNFYMYSHISIP